MKKILSLVLVVSMCFILGSCELLANVFGGNTEVRYTATKEEWDAAMAGKNFTAEITLEMTYTSEGRYNKNANYITVKETDTVMMQVTKAVSENNYMDGENTETRELDPDYTILKDGIYYDISKDGDEWVASKIEGGEPPIDSINNILSDTFFDEPFSYEDFVYNEEEKAYEKEVDKDIMGVDDAENLPILSIYFENGKLVKIEISENHTKELDGYSQSAYVSYVFTNIGSTVIDNVPEYVVKEEN